MTDIGRLQVSKIVSVLAPNRVNAKTLTTPSAATKASRNLKQLESSIIHSLKSANKKQAYKVVAEHIILWDYGEDFVNDPQFEALSLFIQGTLQEHPDLKKIMESLIES